MAEQLTRPIVPTTIRTEFGDVLESEVFQDPLSVGRDLTYVPGYAEMRRDRDIAMKRYHLKEIPFSAVPQIPVRLQWVRTNKASGTPDSTKPVQFGSDGYRLVTQKDKGQPWFKDVPAGATIGAGDEIHQGDCVLMVAEGKTAARRAVEHRMAVDRLVRSSKPTADLQRLGVPADAISEEMLQGRQIAAPPSKIKG